MKDIIRNAEQSDRISLNELFSEELEYHKKLMPDRFNVPETLIDESWLDSVIKSENEYLGVLEIDHKIVGAILYKIKTTPNDIILNERRYGYIQEMIVTESERRKGFGKKLMDHAIEDLIGLGIKEIELNIWEDNESGMKFYKNLGFETISRRMKIKRQ